MAGRGGILDSLEVLSLFASLVPGPYQVAGTITRAGYLKAFGLLTGVLISSLPTKRPKAMEASQSYGWEPSSNATPAAGTPLPVIYGKTRVKPVLKNRYILMDGDKQWLYALYSFSGHKIDERTVAEWALDTTYYVGDEVKAPLSAGTKWYGYTFVCKVPHVSDVVFRQLRLGVLPRSPLFTDPNHVAWKFWDIGHGTAKITDIEINGNPITDYDPLSITYETRPGTAIQGMVTGFDVTYQNNYVGAALKPDTQAWNSNTTYQEGEIVYKWVGAPSELHFYSCVAESKNNTPPNASYWSDLGDVSDYAGDPRYWPATYFTAASVSTEEGTQLYVDISFPNGLFSQQVQAGGTKLMRNACQVKIWCKKATEDWEDSVWVNSDNHIIVKKTRKAFHWTYKWDAPEGEYDVRIQYLVEDGAYANDTNFHEQTAELANVASLVYANFTYPGEALLGIRVLATEKLQGDVEVTAVCERSKVWVNDGTGWVEKAADNHAWGCYDLLAEGNSNHPAYNPDNWERALPPYGGGIPHERIDYASFLIWANYIDSLLPDETTTGYHLNIVFDDFMSLWNAINMVFFEGRGSVMPYGAKYYAIADKPSSPVHLLCEGNIVADSLTQSWGDKSKRANAMEVTYRDADRVTESGLYKYNNVSFIVRTEEWAASDELTDPTKQTLYGTTHFAQAYDLTKYLLNCNETLVRTVNLSVDVEGLDIAMGDVVYLQHFAMGLGVGGRVVSYEENLLDNPTFAKAAESGWDFPDWTGWGLTVNGVCRVKVTKGQRITKNVLGLPYTLPGGGVGAPEESWWHCSNTANFGLLQTMTASPSTTYTISAYCYMPNDLGSSSYNLRLLSHTNQAESVYVSSSANYLLSNQWQRVTLTFTTAADQDHITLWIGGIGRCYWYMCQVEEGSAATSWNQGARVTIDRTVTLSAGKTYQMVVRDAAGNLESHTDTIDVGSLSYIRFATRFTTPPSQYCPYAFGESGSCVGLFRAVDVRRTGEMRKNLTLLEYDASVYDTGDIPDIGLYTPGGVAKPAPDTFNEAENLTLSEFISTRPTGEYQSNIVVTWTPDVADSWGQWEVFVRDVTAGDPNWIGEWAAGSYDVGDKVTNSGKSYISLTDSNTDEPISI